MRKQLLFFNLLFSSLFCFSQSSGSFTGTLAPGNSDIYTINSTGNGKYVFTGNFTGNGNGVSAVAYIGNFNDYNIGADSVSGASGNLNFETTCINGSQIIGVQITGSGFAGTSHGYTLNYQFTPTTYGTDSEPNDTYAQAINTTENTNYEGWFDEQSDTNNQDIDDWYHFTAPRDGKLTIIVNSDITFSSQMVSMSLFDNNGQPIIPDTDEDSGTTRTYTFENFNESGNDFGIRLNGGCTSYQFSWNIQSTATTTINDSNFEQLLVNLGYDDTVDGNVLTQNIESVTTLDISSSNISDLTGIEDFTSLVNFTSIQNPLTTVDFSNNLNLETINIINNPITSVNVSQNVALTDLTVSTQTGTLNSIDVSQNINLTSLELGANNLTTIDISNNTQLTYLGLGNNLGLTTLDVSNNLALESIGIYFTSITDLDLSNHPNIQSVLCYNGLLEILNLQNGNNFSRNSNNNQILTTLNATNNPNLLCIQVDDVSSAESNPNWQKDAMAVYSVDCAATLSISSNDVSSSIIVYPNPVKDNLTIEYFDNIKKIEIYNIVGKKIKSKEQPNSLISMNGMKSGIYFLKIETGFGIVTKKVIKE